MGALFSTSVEEYSVNDLREVAHCLRIDMGEWDGFTEDGVLVEVDTQLDKLRTAPPNVRRTAIFMAAKRHSIADVRAASEDAGLEYKSISEIEKRALFERISHLVASVYFPMIPVISLELLARRLETGVSTPSRTKEDIWKRVKDKLRIYGAASESTSLTSLLCGGAANDVPASIGANPAPRPIPGPSVALDPSKISPALWIELEQKLGVACNMNLWSPGMKVLFLTDISSIMSDENESVAPDDPNTSRRPMTVGQAAPDRTSPEAHPTPASVVARQMTASELLLSYFFTCRFCASVWPSAAGLRRHEFHCRKYPNSRIQCELRKATVAVDGATATCKHCGGGCAGENVRQDHEARCLANPESRQKHTPAVFSCEHCGRTFDNRRGYGSHKQHCPKNPRRRGVAILPAVSVAATSAHTSDDTPPARRFTYSCRCGRRFWNADHCVTHKRQCHVELVAISLFLRGSSPTEAARLRSQPLDHPSPNPSEAERLRTDVVNAVWDHEVFQTLCSVDWGESSRAILCYLLWRNIDMAAKQGRLRQDLLHHFLVHFEAPVWTPDRERRHGDPERWNYVMDMLLRGAPEEAEERLRTWLRRVA